MNGGSDFEATKVTLHYMLNDLKALAQSPETIQRIIEIQRAIQLLEE
ncbi:hypothetical protein UFOVP558_21 [uncultured Caudovirales phage]|uniref:Uncharacterized protein n=1 Tax=uncultured Caudovirales phage TaxID=2100421 RepID=A0A6J5MUN5_9CAUD|nr:hypothetical protein UFOVP558_21 [uncultured Caudovirales phage]